ncbi:hypothetical protein M0802_014548, partial [Mischocyttarus mexicanus]
CQRVKRTELKKEEILEGKRNEKLENWLRLVDKQKREFVVFTMNEKDSFGEFYLDDLSDCVHCTSASSSDDKISDFSISQTFQKKQLRENSPMNKAQTLLFWVKKVGPCG